VRRVPRQHLQPRHCRCFRRLRTRMWRATSRPPATSAMLASPGWRAWPASQAPSAQTAEAIFTRRVQLTRTMTSFMQALVMRVWPAKPTPPAPSDLVLVLVLHRGEVTVSSAGPGGLFKGMTTATSGVLARFPLLLPVRNSVASYGASAVTRTSDRGHVAEVKNQCHRSGGVSIRVSKETFLPLNVQPVFSF